MATPDRITPSVRLDGADGEAPRDGCASAIDWAFLARQCFGDRALETELLTLFSAQAADFAAGLAEAADDEENGRRRAIAHKLKGSASAIGAFDLAGAAEAYEKALEGAAAERLARSRDLSARLDDARRQIAGRLDRA